MLPCQIISETTPAVLLICLTEKVRYIPLNDIQASCTIQCYFLVKMRDNFKLLQLRDLLELFGTV